MVKGRRRSQGRLGRDLAAPPRRTAVPDREAARRLWRACHTSSTDSRDDRYRARRGSRTRTAPSGPRPDRVGEVIHDIGRHRDGPSTLVVAEPADCREEFMRKEGFRPEVGRMDPGRMSEDPSIFGVEIAEGVVIELAEDGIDEGQCRQIGSALRLGTGGLGPEPIIRRSTSEGERLRVVHRRQGWQAGPGLRCDPVCQTRQAERANGNASGKMALQGIRHRACPGHQARKNPEQVVGRALQETAYRHHATPLVGRRTARAGSPRRMRSGTDHGNPFRVEKAARPDADVWRRALADLGIQ